MFNKNRIKNYIFFKFNPSLRKYYLKKLNKKLLKHLNLFIRKIFYILIIILINRHKFL